MDEMLVPARLVFFRIPRAICSLRIVKGQLVERRPRPSSEHVRTSYTCFFFSDVRLQGKLYQVLIVRHIAYRYRVRQHTSENQHAAKQPRVTFFSIEHTCARRARLVRIPSEFKDRKGQFPIHFYFIGVRIPSPSSVGLNSKFLCSSEYCR